MDIDWMGFWIFMSIVGIVVIAMVLDAAVKIWGCTC